MPHTPRRYSSSSRVRQLALCMACVIASALTVDTARAGGAESLFLVVNERSWSSLSIANHYIRLRRIPPNNVMYVDWREDNERIDGDTCREKLLIPVLSEIRRRGLADHIDYIVYSADFPWLVDCSADPAPADLPPVLAPQASLTGATYFHEWFLKRQIDYRHIRANGYYRPYHGITPPGSQGFRSWYGWNEEGRLLEAGGMNYVISTMLGVTSGRGNSTSEVMAALTAAVKADHSAPIGKIYFAKNVDVRSTTRHDLFPAAVEAITNHGSAAEIVEGRIPANRPDVLGLMLGTASFSLPESRSKIRPGAICEHLTSLGGILYESAGQTPISEFVRGGAALTAGAVVEPFAVPQKFPTAYMHLHYVRGCTAGESYYQATNGPYQMLVLGDPLCRPWGKPAFVSLDGISSAEPLAGIVRFVPTGGFEGGAPTARFELFIDGLLYTDCLPGDGIGLDTGTLADGYHELRIVCVGKEPLEARSATLVPVTVANKGVRLSLSRPGIVPDDPDAKPWKWGDEGVVRVSAAGEPAPTTIVLMHGTRRIGQVAGSSGEIRFDPHQLGVGPVTLQAYALAENKSDGDVVSSPLEAYVEPADPLPTYALAAGAQYKPGVLLTAGEKPPQVVRAATFDTCLADVGAKAGEPFELTGLFSVDEDGVYQFHVRHAMELELLVDDRSLSQATFDKQTIDYVPVPLATGLHKLTLRGKVGASSQLDVRFGLRGVQTMRPVAMTHIAPEAAKK